MEKYKEIENKIIDNLKLEISISKFRKENSKYLLKKPVNRIKRIIITIISLLTATSGTILFAYSLKEFKNKFRNVTLLIVDLLRVLRMGLISY